MQYLIEGADKSTGQDRSVIVSADNPRDAQRQAEEMNLLISSVVPHAAGIPNPKPVDYASSRTPPPDLSPAQTKVPPRYIGLQIASLVLGASCLIFYGLAGLSGIMALFAVAAAARPPTPFGPPPGFAAMSGLAGFWIALCLFAAAAVQHGLSAACTALRDIARNSFGWRKGDVPLK
jgi:hypothetical protein